MWTMSDYYEPFIEIWCTQEEKDGVARIFQKGSQYYERIYIIEAQKKNIGVL